MNTIDTDSRQLALNTWLEKTLQHADFRLTSASADASFRRYFRFSIAKKSYILMDAPTPAEDCSRFVATQHAFVQAGLLVPQIIAQDIPLGLLLLSDLGDTLLLSKLTEANPIADDLRVFIQHAEHVALGGVAVHSEQQVGR